MNAEIADLIGKYELQRLRPTIEKYLRPCISFDLAAAREPLPPSTSKLGGSPGIPPSFSWPTHNGRPLDFLLQVDLDAVSNVISGSPLPSNGVLSFFYDIEEQPWGFDPKDLSGFKVYHFGNKDSLGVEGASKPAYLTREYELNFRSSFSAPMVGSRSYAEFDAEAGRSDDEADRYFGFLDDLSRLGSEYADSLGGRHRLLGHAENVQGDMQLEAQLVTNGLYCGNDSGYRDPRAAELEKTAEDWTLLLQLDSDYGANLEWGDAGMLYFWIRTQDLTELKFENVWMCLQCG